MNTALSQSTSSRQFRGRVINIETKKIKFDEYLRNETDIAGYLEAALQEGRDDPAYMLHMLNTIARARKRMQTDG